MQVNEMYYYQGYHIEVWPCHVIEGWMAAVRLNDRIIQAINVNTHEETAARAGAERWVNLRERGLDVSEWVAGDTRPTPRAS